MLPPAPLVKKCMPSVRSSMSMPQATVRAGKAKIMSRLVTNTVQVNSGMRKRYMPGRAHLMIVTRKLMPVMVEPTPEISTAHSQ